MHQQWFPEAWSRTEFGIGRKAASRGESEGASVGCRNLAVEGRSKRRQLQRRCAQAEKCLSLWRLMEKLNNTKKRGGT